MKTFVSVVVAFLVIDLVGKLYALYARDFERKPGAIALDGCVSLGFIVWGTYALASI